MTRGEFIRELTRLYDEYDGNSIDISLNNFIEGFVDKYVSTFLRLIPNEHLSPLVTIIKQDNDGVVYPLRDIEYHGLLLELPNDYFDLVSFKYSQWEKTLFKEDLITPKEDARRRQENKFTAGGISRPVMCIEQNGNRLVLAFWGWRGMRVNGIELNYLKKCETVNDTFLLLPDYIITAYSYYVLSEIFLTTKEETRQKGMLENMLNILALHQITPTQPIHLTTDKK